jgi:IS30 family transposase
MTEEEIALIEEKVNKRSKKALHYRNSEASQSGSFGKRSNGFVW